MKKKESIEKGRGSYLTKIQEGFLEKLKEYGNVKDAIAHSDMSRENLFYSLRKGRTKFYLEFQKAAQTLEKDLQYSKLSNLESLRVIRDSAMENGEWDTAMKAIDAINKMAGHFAPAKKEVNNTNVSIQAKIGADGKIDMTKPKPQLEDGMDIEYTEVDE